MARRLARTDDCHHGFLDGLPTAEPAVVEACRQLEHEGLAGGWQAGRAFITATSASLRPEARQHLRVWLEGWLRATGEAGFEEETVTALIAVAWRKRGSSDPS